MRVRQQDGQTATEYLGILVVILAIVVAIGGTSPGQRISSGLSHQICKIIHAVDGAKSCAASPKAKASTPAGPSGPPLGDGSPISPGVPWDGSATVGERTNPGNGPYLEASISKDRSPCRPDSDGNYVVNLGVTGTIRIGASATVGGGKTAKGAPKPSATLDVYAGQDVRYGITTDSKRADAITKKGASPPTPADPTSIPEGTALTLDKSTYTGFDLSGSYSAIQGSLGYEKGHSVSTAVQRVDASHVQVLVGDSDYVKQAVELGVGTDDLNVSFGHDDTLTTGKAKSVDIDISTPAGRLAYTTFLKTGKLPADGGPISNAQSSQTDSAAGGSHVGGKAGPVDLTLSNTDYQSSTTVTKADGATRGAHTETQYAQVNDYSVSRTTAYGGDGAPPTSSNTIRLQHVNQLDRNGLDQLGIARPKTGDDVEVTLTDGQLYELRDAAIDQIVASYKRDGEKVSRDFVIKQLGDPRSPVTLPSDGDLFRLQLAKAKDPTEILNALYRAGERNGGVFSYLNGFDQHSKTLGAGRVPALKGKAGPSHC